MVAGDAVSPCGRSLLFCAPGQLARSSYEAVMKVGVTVGRTHAIGRRADAAWKSTWSATVSTSRSAECSAEKEPSTMRSTSSSLARWRITSARATSCSVALTSSP